MNLTLSVNADKVEQARKRAEAMGKSLNQLIREYIDRLAGPSDVERDIAEFRRLSDEAKGNARGWKFNRDEIHERS
jgi:hypothetical protein